MRHFQFVIWEKIQTKQQATAKLLLNGVEAVAHGHLHRLRVRRGACGDGGVAEFGEPAIGNGGRGERRLRVHAARNRGDARA